MLCFSGSKKALCQVVPGIQHVQVVYNPVNVEEIEGKAQIPGDINWKKMLYFLCCRKTCRAKRV